MTVSFTKLQDGSWGLKGYNSEMRPGSTVTVRKRDGSHKRVTVGPRVGGDKVQSFHRIAGESTPRRRSMGGRPSSGYQRRRCYCSRPLDEGDGECMYCGCEIR